MSLEVSQGPALCLWSRPRRSSRDEGVWLGAFLPPACVGSLPVLKSHFITWSKIFYEVKWQGWKGPGSCFLYLVSCSVGVFLLSSDIGAGWASVWWPLVGPGSIECLPIAFASGTEFMVASKEVAMGHFRSSSNPKFSLFPSHPRSPKEGNSKRVLIKDNECILCLYCKTSLFPYVYDLIQF